MDKRLPSLLWATLLPYGCMRQSHQSMLVCLQCRGPLELHIEQLSEKQVLSGSLSCKSCSKIYLIVDGVPRMNESMEEVRQTQRVFSEEWASYESGNLESKTIFGRTESRELEDFYNFSGLTPENIGKKTILDVGCGSGRLACLLGQEHAGMVVAVDHSESVVGAFERSRELENVLVIQANLMNLPLIKPFDCVYAFGVVHHLKSPSSATTAISRLVSPRGVLFIWVYSRQWNPFRFGKRLFDLAGGLYWHRGVQKIVIEGLSIFLWGALRLRTLFYRLLRRTSGGFTERSLIKRDLPELRMTVLDALSPEYASEHSVEEVSRWLVNLDFLPFVFADPNVAIRGLRL